MGEVFTAQTKRWGAKEERSVTGFATVVVDQFMDLRTIAPQKLSLALYAFMPLPIAGIAVRWIVQWGAGSIVHTEQRIVLPTVDTDQEPVVLERPALSVLVRAEIISSIPETRRVNLVGLLGPVSPTWPVEVVC